MKYGVIGEILKHSFSKEIHNALADYPYEICEIAKDKLDEFAEKKEFTAINVTIPYKEMIIPHLYYIDEHAKLIGAVNTVVNRDGKLYGYNTDFFGMSKLLEHADVSVKGKKVVILGTGGTCKTSLAVCKALGAREILRVSRSGNEGAITYDELYLKHTDAEVIINTTPCGMFPKCENVPVDLDKFPKLSGVIDAVYNPLRTVLVSEARKRGIHAEGGLYMLVAQAVRASEIFIDVSYPDSEIERVYRKMVKEKENIVLVGMPGCGKSTVGDIISKKMGRTLIDTDQLIKEKTNMEIPDIFSKYGEAKFREIESDVITEVSRDTCKIIATGGGAVLNYRNIEALKRNGRIYFIDRKLEDLIPTSDRPLSSTKEAIEKRYFERIDIYKSVCDKAVEVVGDAADVANKIISEFER